LKFEQIVVAERPIFQLRRSIWPENRERRKIHQPLSVLNDPLQVALDAQELPAGLAAVALNPGIIDTRMLRCCMGEAAGSYPTPEKFLAVAEISCSRNRRQSSRMQ
jgi:hypothetical protein